MFVCVNPFLEEGAHDKVRDLCNITEKNHGAAYIHCN